MRFVYFTSVIQTFIFSSLSATPNSKDVTYRVSAKDPKNDKQNKETEEFLLKWISDKSRHISTYKSKSGKRLIWGGLTFNDTGLKTIKEYGAITKVAVEPKITNYLALPTTNKMEATEPRSTEHGQHPPISRRETGDWLTQKSPSWSLAYMSTPKYVFARRASLLTTDIRLHCRGADSRDYKDFVYNKNAGKGTYIYVQGQGVAYNVEYAPGQREFPREQVAFMQTRASELNGEAKDSDDGDVGDWKDPGHTTGVASNALGQRFGVAKKAILVSAKSTMSSTDGLESINDICFDIPNAGRAKKSVVVISWGIRHAGFSMDAYDDMADDLEDAMLPCLKAGVPIVLAAGNYATPARSSIDAIPQTLNNERFPLIIVGNSDKNGNRWHQSETASGLLYAPGVDVKASDKYGGEQTVTGNSQCKSAHYTKQRHD
jgi:hypothetical protein